MYNNIYKITRDSRDKKRERERERNRAFVVLYVYRSVVLLADKRATCNMHDPCDAQTSLNSTETTNAVYSPHNRSPDFLAILVTGIGIDRMDGHCNILLYDDGRLQSIILLENIIRQPKCDYVLYIINYT